MIDMKNINTCQGSWIFEERQGKDGNGYKIIK